MGNGRPWKSTQTCEMKTLQGWNFSKPCSVERDAQILGFKYSVSVEYSTTQTPAIQPSSQLLRTQLRQLPHGRYPEQCCDSELNCLINYLPTQQQEQGMTPHGIHSQVLQVTKTVADTRTHDMPANIRGMFSFVVNDWLHASAGSWQLAFSRPAGGTG